MKNASIRVLVDVFSGRRNPVIEFKGKKLDELVERLSPESADLKVRPSLPPIPTLGYRGLIVKQEGNALKELPSSFRIADGVGFGVGIGFRPADEMLEDFVCGSVPKEIDRGRIREEIDRYRHLVDFWNQYHWEHRLRPRRKSCRCAPIYEPEWWNVPAIQPENNCYNYGCNYRTDSYAQPGYAAGQQYSSIDCAEVKAAAERDKLIDNPGANNKCPAEGHLVALVVASDGWDYHWYRKGRDRYWSHKPGGGAVTDLDNSGNPIADPRTADRGGYDTFCTFMTVKHGHIKIDGPF